MEINEGLQILLDDNITTTENIYWGRLPTDLDYSEGSISFFRLPSMIDDVSGNILASYQLSVRHTDIYSAYLIKEELLDVLTGYYGEIANKKVVIFVETDDGELWEDDDRIVHLPITISIKYKRI